MGTVAVLGILQVVLWLAVMDTCSGYCFNEPLQSELTESTRVRHYCLFRPEDPGSSIGPQIKLLPGSTVYTADSCLSCTCSMKGLHCCGFGHAAGVVALPSDCEKRLDGCQAMYVKKVNSSRACFTDEPFDMAALSVAPHPDNQLHLKNNINVDLDQLTAKSPTAMTSRLQRVPPFLSALQQPWSQQSNWMPAADVTVDNRHPFSNILASLMRNPEPNTMRRVSFVSSSGSPEPQVTSQVIPLTSHHSPVDPAHDMMLPWMFFN